MQDHSLFLARFDTAECPAALYDLEGGYLCCNKAAAALDEQLLRSLFSLRPHRLRELADGSVSFAAPQELGNRTVSAFVMGEQVVCLFTGRALPLPPQNEELYFARAREEMFQSCLALSSLQRMLDDDRPEVEQLFARVRRGAYASLRDARNLTTLSRFLSARETLSPVCCDIASLLTALCEAANAVREVAVPVRLVGCEQPLPAMVDRALFERAVLNLLDNAMRYTRDGNEVTVSLHTQDDSFVVAVSDRGAGMTHATLMNATEPFYSAEPAADSDARPGLGLGLAVAHHIAQLHGGTLLLAANFGEGSTAVLRLPIGRCDADALHAKSAQYTADAFSPLYIELCDLAALPF
ncbi:MAG: ATP-binding protein [Oscillospiraceae bacterium]|nr:ATP-binding protein [Oscillospiraceae bacterium]